MPLKITINFINNCNESNLKYNINMIDKKSLDNISKKREILIQEKDYVYVLPCKQLRNLISNFTITFPNKNTISDDYTIMPHGSVTLVLFQYKSQFYDFLFGSITKPVKVGDFANKCDVMFIIEFQPMGICPFIKGNQKELANKIIPLSLIDDRLDKELQNIIISATSADELLLEFDKKLVERIRFHYPLELELAIEKIIKTKGNMTSSEISNDVFYSSRQLNRLFNSNLGLSVKSFSRLVRVNNSLRLLNENKMTTASISEMLGYYDVSHFFKDFKDVCGVTPHEYKDKMSSFYTEIAKF